MPGIFVPSLIQPRLEDTLNNNNWNYYMTLNFGYGVWNVLEITSQNVHALNKKIKRSVQHPSVGME